MCQWTKRKAETVFGKTASGKASLNPKPLAGAAHEPSHNSGSDVGVPEDKKRTDFMQPVFCGLDRY